MRSSTTIAALLALTIAAAAGCGGGDDDDGGSTTDAAGNGNDSSVLDARTQPVSRVEDYIRSDTYTQLVLEIDSVPGTEPRTSSENTLISDLSGLLDKPNGVIATRDKAITSMGTDHAWSLAELFSLADSTFDLAVSANAIKMHVMFLDGHYEGDDSERKILGLAWANTHLVLFKQTIESTCAGGLVPALIRDQVCAAAETSVWIHEVGHLLGMVNTGLPMVTDHQDHEHGAHDINNECVMYYAYDSSEIITALVDRVTNSRGAFTFDQACQDDVAAVRDR